jgi:ATP-binding cassette subfamily B protein
MSIREQIETLARDGLVFVVNENNPVNSLTTEQIRKIYTGEITNWKEVGGNDAEIIPIQRNEGAGSQALMIKLIMGLYPVTSGKILVNGTDINEIDKNAYRKRFGTVFQDLQVFAMPLVENVLMRRPESQEDYDTATKALTNAQFDVNHPELTKGLDTIVTREFDESGFIPSGGQAQKIAIARVFAQQPDMVILDEPSSALDPLAEYNMYNNMMRLSEGRGVVFISHRLSSARMADKIFMMKDGKVVETGTVEQIFNRPKHKYTKELIAAAKLA